MENGFFCNQCGMIKDNCICNHNGPKLTKASGIPESRIREIENEYPHIETDIIENFPFPEPREGQLEIARWMFAHNHDDEGARWAQKILSEHHDDPDAAQLLADYHQRRGEAGLANFYKLIADARPKSTATPP